MVWTHFPGRSAADSSMLNPLSEQNSTTPSNVTAVSSVWAFDLDKTTLSRNNDKLFLTISTSAGWLVTISRFLFGIFLCSAILWGVKLVIQTVANNFHEVTYHDRILKAKVSKMHFLCQLDCLTFFVPSPIPRF